MNSTERVLPGRLQRIRMAESRAVQLRYERPDRTRPVQGATQIEGVVPIMGPLARFKKDKLHTRRQAQRRLRLKRNLLKHEIGLCFFSH